MAVPVNCVHDAARFVSSQGEQTVTSFDAEALDATTELVAENAVAVALMNHAIPGLGIMGNRVSPLRAASSSSRQVQTSHEKGIADPLITREHGSVSGGSSGAMGFDSASLFRVTFCE